MLFDSLSYLRFAAVIIAAITMLSSAIGLMNIMLVSVTERTREIGIRKAIGATRHTIRNQFLAEAIVIAQFGGLLGIILGIAIGNALALSIGTSFIISADGAEPKKRLAARQNRPPASERTV